MAIRLGITGAPNTGKSHSRKTMRNAEQCFVLAPSRKAFKLKTKEGKNIQPLKIEGKTIKEILEAGKVKSVNQLFQRVNSKDKGELKSEGNWAVIKEIQAVENALYFIDKHRPDIKTVIIPDFTHFLSTVLSSDHFKSRSKGGEAFARFWDLAADTMNSFFESIDVLREDLVIVIEFHTEYNEEEEEFNIFTPGGKMIKDKFKPDSYFDYMLYTHITKDEDGKVTSYDFITKRWDRYPARFEDCFDDILIPNDLQRAIDALRENEGIEID